MKITKKLTNITKGTWLTDRNGELIVITSDYDSYHKWYEYHETDYDEDGNVVELDRGGYVTPEDLIGGEI